MCVCNNLLFYNCIITNEREYVKNKKEKGYAYMMGQPNHLQGRVVQHAGESAWDSPTKFGPTLRRTGRN